MLTNNPEHAGLRQPFNIVAWVEFGLSFLLLCSRSFAAWKIVKHIASDFYLAIATFVRAGSNYTYPVADIWNIDYWNSKQHNSDNRGCERYWSSTAISEPREHQKCSALWLDKPVFGACRHRPRKNCDSCLPATNSRLPNAGEIYVSLDYRGKWFYRQFACSYISYCSMFSSNKAVGYKCRRRLSRTDARANIWIHPRL